MFHCIFIGRDAVFLHRIILLISKTDGMVSVGLLISLSILILTLMILFVLVVQACQKIVPCVVEIGGAFG